MKIPLVGESYTLRSPAAACQQTLNLIPQFIDDPNEKAKNFGILVGAPGYHQMGDINVLASTSGEVLKGFFSGGGRLFAVTDNVGAETTTLWEIGIGSYVGGNPSTGAATIVSQNAFQNLAGWLPDEKPAQMFGNGNQLGIVKNGYFFIDNGSGPIQARFLVSGTVNVAPNGSGGSTVTWVSGDEFPSAMSGGFITIDGTAYAVTSYSATTIDTLEDAGTQTGAAYTAPYGDFVTAVTGAYLDGYFIVQRPIGQASINGVATLVTSALTWVSGDFFDALVPGNPITFNGGSRVIDTVTSSTTATLTTAPGNATGAFTAMVGADLGRQFNISLPEDGTSWDPLDFAMKEGYPDHLSSILADHEQLYLMGEESMEVWQDTGNALFPFQRIPGAMSKEGSIATYAPTAAAEKVFYIGGSPRGTPVAYRLDGFTPTRISTHAEEAAWSSGIDFPSEAICYAEVHDGHQFWVINFQGALGTWVYDETASEQAGTPIWEQRAAWNGSAFTIYPLRFHTFVPEWGTAGIHVSGDFASGKLFEPNLNYYDDNGASQQWSRTLPHLYAQGKLQFFGRMTLEMDTGSTTSTMLQPSVNRLYSDDRGNTFGNSVPPLTGGSGVNGAASQRVFWPSNGSSRDRVFRFTGNNNGNSRTCLIDVDLEIEVGEA